MCTNIFNYIFINYYKIPICLSTHRYSNMLISIIYIKFIRNRLIVHRQCAHYSK